MNIPYNVQPISQLDPIMSNIHEVATITSKGQLTLPKPIRQALGVTIGGKVEFSLKGGKVVVSRAEDLAHDDPAIEAFLGVLERDICAGKHIRTLPDKLAKAMLTNAKHKVNLDEPIEGKVAL